MKQSRTGKRVNLKAARWRLAILATLVFGLLVIAVPMGLADEAEDLPSTAVTPGPSAEQMLDGFAAVEALEEKVAQELEAPAAIAEREDSQNAFADLAPAEAQDLLLSVFDSQLSMLDSDPARLLDDLHVVDTAGPTVATVGDGEGNRTLLESAIPVKVENDDGDSEKVDLDRVPVGEGYEPANPLTELVLPALADQPISVGEAGLAVTPVAGSVPAQPLNDMDAFYPEVATDTDLALAPTAFGVDIINQIRSADSPETLAYSLQLPPGTETQATAAGGIYVREIETQAVVAEVEPAFAFDAQGRHVPVELEATQSGFTLGIAHRGGEYAYPIYVDPEVVTENYESSWYWGWDLSALNTPGVWVPEGNDPTQAYYVRSTTCLQATFCPPSGRALFLQAQTRSYPANVYTHWIYRVPGATTFIPSIYPTPSVTLTPFQRTNNGCKWESTPEPHDYNGALDAAGNWVTLETDRAQWNGGATMFTKAVAVAVGLGSGPNPVPPLPCKREIALGGTSIRLDDPEAPTLSTPVPGFPAGWIGSATSVNVTPNISDPGLGVRNVVVYPKGKPSVPLIGSNECAGTKVKPCPASRNSTIGLQGGNFDQGETSAQVSGYDPTLEVSNTYTAQLKVDLQPPEIKLKGQLAKATDEEQGDANDSEKWEELILPIYNLDIEALDGSLASAATKRSGVKTISIYLDGAIASPSPWTQTCAASSCSMAKTFSLKLTGLATGKHKLRVVATDQVNQSSEREIEFEYMPATGIEDDYVMHYFPLPDGHDYSEEEEFHGPELAVNVATGNLVYHDRDVEVDGLNLDAEIETYYNSQLPSDQNTEWGDGWTLAQTPEIQVAQGGTEANYVGSSGAITSSVDLPQANGATVFDPKLQTAITKTGTGFVLRDESEEHGTETEFNSAGRVESVDATGAASINYDYDEGSVAEIAVDDPTSSLLPPPTPPAIKPFGVPIYKSQFSGWGTGDGKVNHPADIARASDGTFYVVDKVNNRIQQFSATGAYIKKFGSTGSGTGQFNRPTSIALHPNGSIFITDAYNYRVQIWKDQGPGKGFSHAKSFGSSGTGNGQFSGNGPEGVAIDLQGNVWVSDTYGGRLQKFNSNGEFIKVVGSKGSASGQLGEPTGIDVSAKGQVFVADWQNNRVSVFNEAGEFVRQFGSQGSADGKFNRPDEVEIDNRGNVWIGDTNNERIQEFTQEGVFVAKIGSSGTTEGKFGLTYPMGITSDDQGRLWITDTDNDRIQKWGIPGYVPDYTPAPVASFGTFGSNSGQFKQPADIALLPNTNRVVADRINNRIVIYDANGAIVKTIGSTNGGSGPGQFNQPVAADVDQLGRIYVVDRNNNRIQQFSETGTLIKTFGSSGSGNGQLSAPSGVAVGPDGKIWVADTGNNRIEVFSASGSFVKVVGEFGEGPGQLWSPWSLDFSPQGELFVLQTELDRISKFTAAGEFVEVLGEKGPGLPDLNGAAGLEIDSNGIIWVNSVTKNQVQGYSEDGTLARTFGSAGSGGGQFSFSVHTGIETDESGFIFVADQNNARIQKWVTPSYLQKEDFEVSLDEPNDPAATINVDGSLVDSVEADGDVAASYAFTGDDLVSKAGPDGETTFEYDSEGKLTKVSLPNGTVATVAYEAALKRASKVTVDPAGPDPAESATFTYADEPRKTTVTPSNAPPVFYEFTADGSVFKWQTVAKAPEVTLAGTLWVNRETAAPMATGLHDLEVLAHSPDGVASVQILTNGGTLVEEQQCAQSPCFNLEDEWVIETVDLPPGIMPIEVLVEDIYGNLSSSRFWVNVPYTPPPSLDEQRKPTFNETKRFREAYGLDLDLNPATEQMKINDRIYDLLAAWNNPHTPEGEVARSSAERWGVPLRSVDVGEMEFREWYLYENASRIMAWAAANAPASYGGYRVDHRQGGIMYVGFTQNQAALVASLKASGVVVAAERIKADPSPPTRSLESIAALAKAIGAEAPASSTIVEGGMADNRAEVGALNVAAAESWINARFGAGAPVSVHQTENWRGVSGSSPHYWTRSGPLYGAQAFGHYKIFSGGPGILYCSIGFGAAEAGGTKPNGERIVRNFVLTAGHCFDEGKDVGRWNGRGSPVAEWDESHPDVFGTVKRRSLTHPVENYSTDAEAVLLRDAYEPPRTVLRGRGVEPLRITSVAQAVEGMPVCTTGATSERVRNGYVKRTEFVSIFKEEDSEHNGIYYPKNWEPFVGMITPPGDSGGPVWRCGTGQAVGLISAYNGHGYNTGVAPLLPPEAPEQNEVQERYFPYTTAQAPGILKAAEMGNIHLTFAK